MSAVCALPAPEADAQVYYSTYKGFSQPTYQPAYNQRSYNQKPAYAYTQKEYKESLEREQMEEQMKDWIKSMFDTFIEFKFEDYAKF